MDNTVYNICQQQGYTLQASRPAVMANGHTVETKGKIKINAKIFQQQVELEMIFLPDSNSEIIIGHNTLAKLKMTIEPSNRTITMPTNSKKRNTCHLTPITPDNEDILEKFLAEELNKFSTKPQITHLAQHEIRLTDARPIKQRHRPLNPAMQRIANKEVDEMLKDGIIEPSHSPYSSPIVLIPKQSGEYRFCIDYREINKISIKDAYPIPRIQAILEKLKGARFISTMDLRHGYWQVPLCEESRPISAFTVPGRGLFQFRVMPFGLHSAGATFQRVLDGLIGPEMTEECAYAYLDDIVVVSKTFDEHITHLRRIFTRLRDAGFQLNTDKCKFCRTELEYLGHTVNETGIHTSKRKVAAITEYPAPKTIKQLRRFLGMTSWYRKFIPQFSKTAAPLNNLLKKDTRWTWKEPQQTAFNELKQTLTAAPILQHPDFEKPFYLQTDASNYGIGACLFQKDGDKERVVEYASRTLSDVEKRYSVSEKECLAIVDNIERFRHYLEGYHFFVITDHQSLKWFNALKNPNGRLSRWAMKLQQYDFEISYRRGTLNTVADALSRQPVEDAPEATAQITPLTEETKCKWYLNKKTAVLTKPDSVPDFCIKNQKLYRHVWNLDDFQDDGEMDPWKLCIPTETRSALIKENHDEATAGHLGIAKTIYRMALKYYWPGMFRNINAYVKACTSCQKYKASQQKTPGQMHPTKSHGPWHSVATDLIGPLPRSKKGNVYLAVFQDKFTKWVEIQPLKKATAQTVCDALTEKVFLKFGCPTSITADNGPQFDSKKFRSLLQEFGVRKIEIAPYTPQANFVERANRTVKTTIAQFCENDQTQWDTHLPELTFAINTAKHESTKFTPAFLNFGRELSIPSKVLSSNADSETEDDQIEETTLQDHDARLSRLRDTFKLVRLNLHEASSRQTHYYNLRRRHWQPKIGERVMRKLHLLSNASQQFNAKLAPKFDGPHTIQRIISPVIFILKTTDGKLSKQIHIKDLKKAQPEDSNQRQQTSATMDCAGIPMTVNNHRRTRKTREVPDGYISQHGRKSKQSTPTHTRAQSRSTMNADQWFTDLLASLTPAADTGSPSKSPGVLTPGQNKPPTTAADTSSPSRGPCVRTQGRNKPPITPAAKPAKSLSYTKISATIKPTTKKPPPTSLKKMALRMSETTRAATRKTEKPTAAANPRTTEPPHGTKKRPTLPVKPVAAQKHTTATTKEKSGVTQTQAKTRSIATSTEIGRIKRRPTSESSTQTEAKTGIKPNSTTPACPTCGISSKRRNRPGRKRRNRQPPNEPTPTHQKQKECRTRF